MRLQSLLFAALLGASTAAQAQFGGFKIPDLGGLKDAAAKLSGTARNVSNALREPDEAEEIRLGREFGATLLGAKPLAKDPALQAYVNRLGRWLALQTERPDLPWTFAVLEDPGFNAFATPGGGVFITRGLVARMTSEAELAGVLAHEIAHVLKKHHLRAVQKNAGAALFGEALSAARSNANQQLREAAIEFGKKLYASGLDQGDELEADRMGVVIAARAGYDAFGLPAVLQMLEAQNSQSADFSLAFKTHPAPAVRLAALGALMNSQFERLGGVTGEAPAKRAVALR